DCERCRRLDHTALDRAGRRTKCQIEHRGLHAADGRKVTAGDGQVRVGATGPHKWRSGGCHQNRHRQANDNESGWNGPAHYGSYRESVAGGCKRGRALRRPGLQARQSAALRAALLVELAPISSVDVLEQGYRAVWLGPGGEVDDMDRNWLPELDASLLAGVHGLRDGLLGPLRLVREEVPGKLDRFVDAHAPVAQRPAVLVEQLVTWGVVQIHVVPVRQQKLDVAERIAGPGPLAEREVARLRLAAPVDTGRVHTFDAA